MLIYVKKKKNFLRTDGRTDGQPKTIVRNLTKTNNKNRFSTYCEVPNYTFDMFIRLSV